jgi:hypothetical protein
MANATEPVGKRGGIVALRRAKLLVTVPIDFCTPPAKRRPWRRHGPGEPGSWLTAAPTLGATSVMAIEDRAERVWDQVR